MTMDWVIPFVGIAVLTGGLMAGRAYFEAERETRAHEANSVMLERLFLGQKLNTALKSMRGGDVQGAARELEALFCQSILRASEELTSADAQTRMNAAEAFRRIALTWPGFARAEGAGSGEERTDNELAAERILRKALGSAQTAQVR